MTYDEHVASAIWSTRDGTSLPVFRMSTDHILASLARCQRENWRTRFIPLFLSELASRGLKDSHPELFI